MSATRPIRFKGVGFWVVDTVSGILAKYLIDVLDARFVGEPPQWLSVAAEDWRVLATYADIGDLFEDDWDDSQRQLVLQLIDEACEIIEGRDVFTAEEIEGWVILDGQGVFARAKTIPVEAVLDFARGCRGLLGFCLESPPKGHWWFYTCEPGRKTIKMRS